MFKYELMTSLHYKHSCPKADLDGLQKKDPFGQYMIFSDETFSNGFQGDWPPVIKTILSTLKQACL